jgi:hypothetical protein
MAGAREEQVENHWPGYVDALTTMLMVLTFVMMILGIAVFAMSQNTSRILLEQIAKAAKIELPSGGEAPLSDIADRILNELEREPRGASRDEAAPKPAAAPSGGADDAGLRKASGGEGEADAATRITSQRQAHVTQPSAARLEAATADALIIAFQPRATRLDEQAQAGLDAALKTASALTASGAQVLARVDRATGAVSDARRIAFYRAMLVRERLIAAGVPGAMIRVRLVETPDDGVVPETVRVEQARPDAFRSTVERPSQP